MIYTGFCDTIVHIKPKEETMKRNISVILAVLMLLSSCLSLASCAPEQEACHHEWGEWELRREPTCGEGGYSIRVCNLCDAEDRKVSYALEHPYSTEWVYDGSYHWHPATCQHKAEKSDYATHSFDGNTCSSCGALRATQGLEYRGNLGEDTYRVVGIGTTLDANLVIARYYNGFEIVAVAASAFEGVEGLITVAMQEYITSIGDRAFADCKDLTAVQFSSTVTYLGYHMFDGCDSLQTVYFDGTVAEFNALREGVDWSGSAKGFRVVCSDTSFTV